MSGAAAVALRARNLGKCFTVEHEGRALLRHLFLKPFRERRNEAFWGLRGVDFEIRRGETVGVLGANGSGKSTLLKLIGGVSEASEGSIEIEGRVGALIELGAGFHPQLTGRENVLLNGIVLGLTRSQIEARLPEIAEFAEIGDFLDVKVANYSSGMLARLGFAVAIHTDPDILLVDEVLSVGDERFQRKSIARVREIQERGVAILFVSHSLQLVKKVCTRALVLENGRLAADDRPDVAAGIYLARIASLEGPERERQLARAREQRFGRGDASIAAVRLLAAGGARRSTFVHGEDLRIEIDYRAPAPIADASLAAVLWSEIEGCVVYAVNTRMDGISPFALGPEGTLAVTFPSLRLLRGRYQLSVTLARGPAGEVLDHHERLYPFEVLADRDDLGFALLDHRWEVGG